MKTEKQIRERINELEKLDGTVSPQEWWKIDREIDGLEWVLENE